MYLYLYILIKLTSEIFHILFDFILIFFDVHCTLTVHLMAGQLYISAGEAHVAVLVNIAAFRDIAQSIICLQGRKTHHSYKEEYIWSSKSDSECHVCFRDGKFFFPKRNHSKCHSRIWFGEQLKDLILGCRLDLQCHGA